MKTIIIWWVNGESMSWFWTNGWRGWPGGQCSNFPAGDGVGKHFHVVDTSWSVFLPGFCHPSLVLCSASSSKCIAHIPWWWAFIRLYSYITIPWYLKHPQGFQATRLVRLAQRRWTTLMWSSWTRCTNDTWWWTLCSESCERYGWDPEWIRLANGLVETSWNTTPMEIYLAYRCL